MTSKTLGILGGGQLGRMSAQAAKKLGIRTHIFTPEQDSPASQVADHAIIAEYEDKESLAAFAQTVDVITYEFENIPITTVQFLQSLRPVYPDEKLLEVAQDRIREKSFLNEIGIPTALWAPIHTNHDAKEFTNKVKSDRFIIKTTRFGYDGKGQAKIDKNTDLDNVFRNFKNNLLIGEEIIDFKCEISVIIARDANGNMQTYGPILNEHKNHILHKSICPAPIDSATANKALEVTINLAERLNLIGVLALEMFVTKDGQILANEIAPRTHNSGHYSIDACAVSQFENHVRAVCGLPVLPPDQHSAAEMINLIGLDIKNLAPYEGRPNVFIHDYGKKDALPGRKMGHVTILK